MAAPPAPGRFTLLPAQGCQERLRPPLAEMPESSCWIAAIAERAQAAPVNSLCQLPHLVRVPIVRCCNSDRRFRRGSPRLLRLATRSGTFLKSLRRAAEAGDARYAGPSRRTGCCRDDGKAMEMQAIFEWSGGSVSGPVAKRW